MKITANSHGRTGPVKWVTLIWEFGCVGESSFPNILHSINLPNYLIKISIEVLY